jgi:hypothetical protein
MPQAVNVTGDREVRAAFDALARDVEDLEATHRAGAELLIPGVSQRSPRRSGALAASWSAEASKVAGAVVSGVPYAGPVEYGAHGVPGARMVADTIAEQADAVLELYDQALTDRGRQRGFRTD